MTEFIYYLEKIQELNESLRETLMIPKRNEVITRCTKRPFEKTNGTEAKDNNEAHNCPVKKFKASEINSYHLDAFEIPARPSVIVNAPLEISQDVLLATYNADPG